MSLTTFTIDGNDYQSYASLDEANKRLAVDLTRKATWNDLPDDEAKETHLVNATDVLDRIRWKGKKADVNQVNQFPREGIVIDDVPVPNDVIPFGIEQGTILLAGNITVDPANANPSTITGRGQIHSVRSGDEQIVYETGSHVTPAPITADMANTLISDPAVLQLIKPYLAVSNPPVTNRKVPGSRTGDVSGTSDSSFTDKVFGVTEGY